MCFYYVFIFGLCFGMNPIIDILRFITYSSYFSIKIFKKWTNIQSYQWKKMWEIDRQHNTKNENSR